MKRLFTLLLSAALLLSVFPLFRVGAVAPAQVLDIIRYDDGTYLEILMESAPSSRAGGTQKKSKSYVYHSTDGTSLWKFTLTGTFTYNGTSATCTASSCSVAIYDSSWYTIAKSATRSKNVAYGTATLGCNIMGTTVAEKTYNLTLTCDKNGNFS